MNNDNMNKILENSAHLFGLAKVYTGNGTWMWMELTSLKQDALDIPKLYVECPICTRVYLSKQWKRTNIYIIKKHKHVIPHSNNLGITILPGTKTTCSGSGAMVQVK